MTAPRVTCRGCGAERALTKRGTVRAHPSPDAKLAAKGYHCEGSGEAPVANP